MIYIDINKKISEYFKWREFLWHPQWGRFIMPTPKEAERLEDLAHKLDKVREHYDSPVFITSGLRIRSYNEFIGGAEDSAHTYGMAGDLVVKGYEGGEGCDLVRADLEPMLEELELRMEDLPGSNWVHLDTRAPGVTGRFFKP